MILLVLVMFSKHLNHWLLSLHCCVVCSNCYITTKISQYSNVCLLISDIQKSFTLIYKHLSASHYSLIAITLRLCREQVFLCIMNVFLFNYKVLENLTAVCIRSQVEMVCLGFVEVLVADVTYKSVLTICRCTCLCA